MPDCVRGDQRTTCGVGFLFPLCMCSRNCLRSPDLCDKCLYHWAVFPTSELCLGHLATIAIAVGIYFFISKNLSQGL